MVKLINQNIPNAFSSRVKKNNSDYFLRKGIGDKVSLWAEGGGAAGHCSLCLSHSGGGSGSKASEGGDRMVGKGFQNLMYELPFLRGHWEYISKKKEAFHDYP